jgi:hypothetical protein
VIHWEPECAAHGWQLRRWLRPNSHDFRRSASRTARQLKPMPRRRTTIRILICLLQLGQDPSRRHEAGLPPPPTIPFLNPYTFSNPTVVKITPTAASGSQSASAIIVFQCAAAERISSAAVGRAKTCSMKGRVGRCMSKPKHNTRFEDPRK